MWRETIEMLVGSGRLVHATSYSSHEHLCAVTNLRAIGADVVHAHANGWREEGSRVVTMDLLYQVRGLGMSPPARTLPLRSPSPGLPR